ncbi:SGNH/GDSL hydrolase family protein [Coprobacter secundus]|uniref:Hydrolase n=1 Tax=Coprobacter secundus subsp. similis TaxID=2751153 RepID=A0A7G1I1Z5_9BACT|nr:SGNH/GDSL hydrolase family protein [Coprobacter secundus]BCI64734.1 hydrolase [Coprobacter secundus subsp. similis]
MYRILRLGMVSLLFTGIVDVQVLKYTDARNLLMVGKACSSKEYYHRLDTALFKDLPPKIKYLSTFSCGLAIGFMTNSSVIAAEWEVKPDKPSPNLSAIAHKGLDLYIERNGIWEFAGVGKPELNSTRSKSIIVQEMDDTPKKCLLYLPLFSETKTLKIGVEEGSEIVALPYPFEKKVLVYGSSIVHGAEASRAGTTYVAKLSRRAGIDFINLGFSGNARMENSMADCLADIKADAYILDCVPNATAQQISERTAYLVETIRNKHPEAPIIVMQSIAMDIGNFNLKIKSDLRIKDETIRNEVEKLCKRGVKKLYFIEGKDLIGKDHEGTGDGIHPNDLGFERMAAYLEPKLMEILNNNE